MAQSQQLTIKQAILSAKKATKKGKIADAVQLYKAILAHQPNHPIAKKALRKLQAVLTQNQSVETELLNPSQDQVNALLKLYQSGQMTKTEQACRELLRTHSQSLAVINVLGATLKVQGKLREAVASFDSAIQLKPDFAEAYSNRGTVLKELGELQEAVASYEKAIQLKPDFAEAYSNHGNVLKDLRRLDEAIQNYDMAIQLRPDYAEAYNSKGVALEQLGKTNEAVKNYEKATQLKPDYAEAYNNHADLLQALGHLNKAVKNYDKAIQLTPDYAGTYNNRGVALAQLRQLDDAIESYETAIKLKPDYAEAYYNRGNALKNLGQLDEAVLDYDTAIQFKPDYVEAYLNRGARLQDLGRLDEAMQDYDEAIRLKPDYAEAYYNRGNTLKNLGLLDEAVQSYDKAIQHKPDYAKAYNNRGARLQDLGRLDEALQNYNKATQLAPDYAEAYNNKAVALEQLGKLNEALQNYGNAIRLAPDYAEAYNNKAVVLEQLGRLHEAMESYEKAAQLKPDYAESFNNHAGLLQGLGQLEEALQCYNKAIHVRPDFTDAYSNLLMTLNYSPKHNSIDHITMARRFGELATKKAEIHFSSYQGPPTPLRLRVGFVSGDLRNHPIGYFLENILSSIDASKIELIAYSTTPKIDALSDRIKPFFSMWKPIYGQNDKTVANLINTDGVQVLIDLSGHTANNRLPMFACKPSPVQVSWLGYFATTGLNEMDYLLGDPHVTPSQHDDHFTETIWRLPETRWCFTPPELDAPITVPPALERGYITFGCFNNLTKINNEVVKLWAKVLDAVPDSRLFLKAKQFNNKLGRESIIRQFIAQGIDSKRISLEESENRQKYFAAYNQIDISLDPFPFNGGTTSVESLWMGVPLITLAGNSLISRQGVGVLTIAGLPDWIADDKESYLAKAISFASELDKLAGLRASLRSQILASPLFDAARFARNFENALFEMWNQYAHQDRKKYP